MGLALARSAALAGLVTLAACGSSGSEKAPSPGSAPGSASGAPPPRTAEPAPSPETLAPLPAGAGLPEECNEYRKTIERLSQCGDALPESTRDNLKTQLAQQWRGWETLPDQDKRALAGICKRSSDSVKTAAAAACSW